MDPQCWLKDDITDLLKAERGVDGIVFASPIYYCNVTAQLRAFWERLMYPGPGGREIPTALIYTGNATEEQFREFMGRLWISTPCTWKGAFTRNRKS